jgi:hypothetical protein
MVLGFTALYFSGYRMGAFTIEATTGLRMYFLLLFLSATYWFRTYFPLSPISIEL